MYIIDKKTGKKDDNLEPYKKAIFAHIWLGSAGVKWMYGDKNNGETYAFNDQAREIYERMCEKFKEDIENIGTIDTVSFFEEMVNHHYKHAQEIALNLFRNKTQTDLIDELFKNSHHSPNINENIPPPPLYTYEFAGRLISKPQNNRQR